jgi:Phosphotransferase enzyme family
MTPNAETDIFHLIIPRNGNSEVLLQTNGESYSLPQVEIPKWRRAVEFLTKRVKENWGLETVCLFDPRWEDADRGGWRFNYQVIEPRDSDWIPPSSLRWMKLSLVSPETFECTDQLRALERSLDFADAFNSGERPGPFAKAGWIDDLMKWMQFHLYPLGLTLTGSFRQLNGNPFFSLIRFETNASAVWFKAVGEPNLQEYEITKKLAESHPEFLPTIIATRPEWHGLLMAEVDGTNLRNSLDLDQWRLAVSTLASLQIDLIGRTDWLLQIGCKDRRLSKILDDVDPFLEVMVEVMQRQPKTPPEILTRPELLELGKRLKDACHRLESAEVLDTLVHGDFNPANIRVTLDHRCVFLDWAEGYVGPPSVTFEHLLANLRRNHPELTSWEEPLRETYMARWKTVVTSRQISEAMVLTPLIAVLCYALSSDGWRDSQRVNEPNFAKHMRSLVRRMHKEVSRTGNSASFIGQFARPRTIADSRNCSL